MNQRVIFQSKWMLPRRHFSSSNTIFCIAGAWDIPRAWQRMVRSVRNLGRPGAGAMAISAVDIALWDLKAKLLGLPLAQLLGKVRDCVPIYGSGGFTSYSVTALQSQLSGWAERGFGKVKMKVGARPEQDVERVRAARDSIGPACELYVDANGAYGLKQALRLAEEFVGLGVSWLEEPVSSDDLEGLSWIRGQVPAGIEIAAGEYGFDPGNLTRLLGAQAVDVLQIDATRCLGITGFLQAAAVSEAHFIPISSHCAPSVHLALGCALPRFRHIEFFFDHVRIERMFFEGAEEPKEGLLRPDLTRPGLGLVFKRVDAKYYHAG